MVREIEINALFEIKANIFGVKQYRSVRPKRYIKRTFWPDRNVQSVYVDGVLHHLSTDVAHQGWNFLFF